MKKCLIISGGDYCSLPDQIEYEYVIACDKGVEYASKLGVEPDFILGDFDSYTGTINLQSANVQSFPIQKDDSDTMLGIKHALSLGYTHITIVCALGGRMDHTLANIQSMNYVAAHDGICEIISDSEHLISFTGPVIEIPRKTGYSLSLFAMSDSCDNVSIKGAGYDVDSVTITNTFPIGLSNYWKDSKITISMQKGIMLIVMSKHSQ